jgi:hypothetical protein
VAHLVSMIDELPRAAKRCWNDASSRTFDIGVQAGLSPSAFNGVQLGEAALRQIARVRGRVLVTIYAPRTEQG